MTCVNKILKIDKCQKYNTNFFCLGFKIDLEKKNYYYRKYFLRFLLGL